MSVTLRLTFPAGRYHATPWGRHVNEGVAEWPPSPWRLLRALVAVWKRACNDLPEDAVRRILRALVDPPSFALPASREAHTRHYVPWEKRGPADRTLIFDTFVAVGREAPVFIHWPDASLNDEERAALRRLAENLSTLGRAESWVRAEYVEAPDAPCNCLPEIPSQPGQATVRVLCPDSASAFEGHHYPKLDPKKLKKGLAASDLLFDCPPWHLCLDTETIHARRWPNVPGARWVNYVRIDATDASVSEIPAPSAGRFTVARYLLDGPVLPSIFETLPLAEQVRNALMSRYQFFRRCEANDGPPPGGRFPDHFPRFASIVFSGKGPDGQPLRDNSGAYYLPADEDGDGRIDHVTVYAEAGFGGPDSFEVRALDALRTLRFGDAELAMRLVGLGRPEDFSGRGVIGLSDEWISATPFLVTRHLKLRGRRRDPREWAGSREGTARFVLQVLHEALERRGIADAGILPLDPSGTPRPVEFRLFRRKRDDDGGRRPRGLFRIRLAEPRRGPIALGHSGHFGLGLFLPA